MTPVAVLLRSALDPEMGTCWGHSEDEFAHGLESALMVSRPTRTALFALSGNECAFPGCDSPMVDAASGSVVGEVCHIRAQNPTGPRYLSGLDDWQVHGPANLILLCSQHHKIVDDHPDEYTIAQLEKMKNEHEAVATPLNREQLLVALEPLSVIASELSASAQADRPMFERVSGGGGLARSRL